MAPGLKRKFCAARVPYTGPWLGIQCTRITGAGHNRTLPIGRFIHLTFLSSEPITVQCSSSHGS